MRAREHRAKQRQVAASKKKATNFWNFVRRWAERHHLQLTPPCVRQGLAEFMVTESQVVADCAILGSVYACTNCRNGIQAIQEFKQTGKVEKNIPSCRQYPMLDPSKQKELGAQVINAFIMAKKDMPRELPTVVFADGLDARGFLWLF